MERFLPRLQRVIVLKYTVEDLVLLTNQVSVKRSNASQIVVVDRKAHLALVVCSIGDATAILLVGSLHIERLISPCLQFVEPELVKIVHFLKAREIRTASLQLVENLLATKGKFRSFQTCGVSIVQSEVASSKDVPGEN